MHVNKFEDVAVPTARDVFSRFGSRNNLSDGYYTGDEVVSESMSKTDMLDNTRHALEAEAARIEYANRVKIEQPVAPEISGAEGGKATAAANRAAKAAESDTVFTETRSDV